MSGFKYKGTDLNDMINAINQNVNIKDANTTFTLSPYYKTLTNSSGSVPAQSIARLGTDTKYTIQKTDIKEYVMAKYNDYTNGVITDVTRPSWSTSCSVILIGAGGSGAGGTQGFNPSPGQSKNAQQGNCGGGGGAGGILVCKSIPLNSNSIIKVCAGTGATATGLDQAGSRGQDSYVSLLQGNSPQFTAYAYGGSGGNLGQGDDTGVGTGGAGGQTLLSLTNSVNFTTYPYQGNYGQNGSSPGPSNSSQFTFCNGGTISTSGYGNILPIQIISNGGVGQQQGTWLTSYQNYPASPLGQYGVFANVQGYGAGGAGGAGGNQGGSGPVGSQGGSGGNGLVRIYWLNTTV